MADISNSQPTGPVTADGFLADRMRFWGSVTRFMTGTIVALVVLLLILWWWLV